MSINKHTFFCRDLDCEKEVEMNGMGCEDHETDTTSECPGCGMDLYVGANGYCSHCWVERFGCEEEHECHGEMDYERGVRVCDDQDDPACPQHYLWKDEPESWQRQNCECHHAPLCRLCEIYYGYEDEGPYDGRKYDCTNCKREFKNKYWRNQSLCRDCEDLPPLPSSPEPVYRTPDDVREEMAQIEDKLKLGGRGMTSAQYEDWHKLLRIREVELAEMWAGYDRDDLRKLDLQLRR